MQRGYRQLSQELANFVPRKEQNYLVAEITKVLCGHYHSSRRVLVAEAGTGIGKSLAYLQAAVPSALGLNKTLVISTATLSLQEQLINKDLPFYAKHAGSQFRYTLVKGRQRYCCEHRLEQLAAAGAQQTLSFGELLDFKPDQQDKQCYQAMWQAYTGGQWAGDLDSWPETVRPEAWAAIAADRHSCNPMFAHHRLCPFQRARAELDQCQVLVVNHALLLADLALGGGVILPEPENCFYVFDEAHHLPNIARDQGAAQLMVRQTRSWLARLPTLGEKVSQQLKRDSLIGLCQQLNDEVQSQQQGLLQLSTWLQQQANWFADDPLHRFELGPLPDHLVHLSEELLASSQKLRRSLEKLKNITAEGLKDGQLRQHGAEPLLVEISHASQRVEQAIQLWTLFKSASQAQPLARWVAQHIKEKDHSLHASPLEMGAWLERQLWSRCAGAILVSATLTALGKFDYFRHQAGLFDEAGVRFLRLQSPFDYQRAELYLPSMPCEPGSPDFTAALIEKLPDLLKEQQASLVLFSSYQQMQTVADGLRAQHGLSLLVQGEASREALLHLHQTRCDHQTPSILFGTGSFSEGLDLPGHYLTNLIITKLPFAVPTSPVEAALAEWISARGGNPFLQITVPEASRKLIQACGRLIRKEQDAGRVVLLDRRLLTKSYGPGLLAALPPFRRHIEP
ncbi:ATP-dependent DNA helicase DinG [Pseudaeromonas paramecii]|uniref:ATP-dependent DNA helicase DinG n=1 Tax=Pseudaeromonas paramecii TaxID=2138166 RepID=A0ABP8PTS3_9GAMM